MKVWITRYALTKGIEEMQGATWDSSPTMIDCDEPGQIMGCYYHKPYWHTTREEAVIQANKMVQQKITSCQKQLKKLQALKFE